MARVRLFLNTDILLNVDSCNWGAIILLWYRTSIELEHASSFGQLQLTEPVDVTESHPGQWDKLDVYVDNFARMCPVELSAITAPDNAAAPYITNRPLSAFHSVTTYQTIKDWISTCYQHHSAADCPRHTDEILPRRIIDVGSSQDCIVSLNVSTNMRGTYIALSHVWGAEIHNKLKMKLLQEWSRSIDVRILPQSFQDAITVTRKLGLRYIWIDALCIVQDSLKDWELESSKMGDVFKNSFLTIAVSATSQDPDGFLTRNSPYASSCQLELLSTEGKSCGHVWVKPQASPKGKIDTRAWCLQENILSTRVLTFTSEECFFECRKNYRVSESGVYSFSDSRYFCSGGKLIEALSRAAKEFQNAEALDKSRREAICQTIAEHWYTMIGNPATCHLVGSGYGTRHLTYTSDKLPALSGLAHEVHRIIQCKYLAGIWECHILLGLLWRRVRKDMLRSEHIPEKLGDPQAPSWSWAASNGPLEYVLPWYPIEVINIISCGTTLVGGDPMGRVSAGWITLNGPISEICCTQDQPSCSDYRKKVFYLVTTPGEELSQEAEKLRSNVINECKKIDDIRARWGESPRSENYICHAWFDEDDYFSSSVTCLLFRSTEFSAHGLILQRVGRNDEYRRVGYWGVQEDRPDLASLWP
ncbi:hypothetical protein B7463_g11675, partial [Scytalidium lignicola]